MVILHPHAPALFVQVSRVQPAVEMPLDADEEEVAFSTAADTAPPQPYLQYGPDDSGGGGDKGGVGGAGDGQGGGTSIVSRRARIPTSFVG